MVGGWNGLRRWLARRRKPRELSVAEAYARWAARYAPEAHNPLMELEQRALLELLPEVAGRRALDVACGSGRYLAHLLERGARWAMGVDFSGPMLGRARHLPTPLFQADLLALPCASSSFEIVTSGLAVGHVADLTSALKEMARVLVPRGALVYSDFHPLGALAGWQRTFKVEGKTYAVQHHVHLYADHVAACRAADLFIEDVREPRLEQAGRWRGWPGALVIRARKG